LAFCEAYDIDNSDKTMDYVTQLARTSGGLRVIGNFAEKAKRLTDKKKVTHSELREVANSMMGPNYAQN